VATEVEWGLEFLAEEPTVAVRVWMP
jgi:hypothetical protein